MKLSDEMIRKNFGEFEKKKVDGCIYYNLKNGDVINPVGDLFKYSESSTQYFFKTPDVPHSFNRVEHWTEIFRLEIDKDDSEKINVLPTNNIKVEWSRISPQEAAEVKKQCGVSSSVKSVSPFPKQAPCPSENKGERICKKHGDRSQ